MLKKVNPLNHDDMFELTKDSLLRGEEVRRNGINWLTIISVVVLSMIAFFVGLGPVFFVALSVFAATYSIVYAIYSVSASINIHLDIITCTLAHKVSTDNNYDVENK